MTVVRLYYGGSGEIECEAFQTKADVHFEYYEHHTYGERIKILGDTKPVKDLIKSPSKDKTGRYWTGEHWEARASATALLAEALMEKLPSVTADIEAIEADGSLSKYHGEFEGDEDEGPEMVMAVNGDDGEIVLNDAVAKDMADFANYDSVDDMVDGPGLSIADTEYVKGLQDVEDEDWDVTVIDR